MTPKLHHGALEEFRRLMMASHQRMLKLEATRQSILTELKRMVRNGERLVFWGANANSDQVVGGQHIPNVVLLDSNQHKASFVQGYSAMMPSDAWEALHTADLVVIFADRMWSDEIRSQLRDIVGRDVPALMFDQLAS